MSSRITRRKFLGLAGTGTAFGALAAWQLSTAIARAQTAVPTGTPTGTPTAAPTEIPATATAIAAARRGGVLRYAYNGDPPTLDIPFTQTYVTEWVGLHMFETLFTYDDKLAPLPDLAESYEVSQDGLTYTVKLRKGIPFHNGKEMIAEDVDASLRRWANLSGPGKALFDNLESLTSPDNYTLSFKLKQVFPLFEATLAIGAQCAVIYPKEVVQEAGDGEVKRLIGTGPYKMGEWQRDRFLSLVRFDNYVSHGDRPNGYGGKKNAYLDEIRYIPVPDQSVRIAGMLSGEYDYVDEAPRDQYALLKDNPRVKTALSTSWRLAEAIANMKSPIMSDVKLRQAMQAATNAAELMKASQGHEDFYRLNPSLMGPETSWYTEAGKEFYNQNNPEKAKQLLSESKYKGETLRWLTTKEFPGFYEEALAHSQQMQAIGINVNLEAMEWANVVTRYTDLSSWEMLTSGWGPFADPALSPQFLGTAVGDWQTEKSDALRKQLIEKVSFQDRFKIWEDMQRLWYEEVPCVYYGNTRGYRIMNPKLMDANLEVMTRAMWNAWFED